MRRSAVLLTLVLVMACAAPAVMAGTGRARVMTRRSGYANQRVKTYWMDRMPVTAKFPIFERTDDAADSMTRSRGSLNRNRHDPDVDGGDVDKPTIPEVESDYDDDFDDHHDKYGRYGYGRWRKDDAKEFNKVPDAPFDEINRRIIPHVVLIERPVVEPAATVDRALAEQPVHPHLIEVFLLDEGGGGASTIFLNPEVDYEHQGYLHLDENHFINRTQRLARSLRTRGSHVVRSAAAQPYSTAAPQPYLIIERPGMLCLRPTPRKVDKKLVLNTDR